MRILITGSTGLLGRELVKKFSRHSLLLPSSNELNVTNAAQVYRFCRENKPDIIIHSAAYTNVDACEINPELAFAVNADGSKNIARAAYESGARLIGISSDYVFDGKLNRPYSEYDVPFGPLSVYGQSKLLGEQNIQNSWPHLHRLHGRSPGNQFQEVFQSQQLQKPCSLDSRFDHLRPLFQASRF